MELTEHAATFERSAATYDRVGVDFFAPFGQQLVDAAALAPGQSVLDIGTGRGAVLGPAAKVVGADGRAVGVDLAPSMVELTAADLADLDQVRVEQADATDLPLDLGEFDAVLSSLVVFFTDDPAQTLRHWASFVVPGGTLGLVTFVADPDDVRFTDVVMQFLPERDEAVADAPPSSFELVRDPEWLDGALADAGVVVESATVHRHEVRFGDTDQWWDWVWSHGMRAALEMVPTDQLDAARSAGGRELEENPLPDGSLGMHVSIRVTVAGRPLAGGSADEA